LRKAIIRGLAPTIAGVLAAAGSAHGAANFHIRGGGYGHGIGMSQYGSYGYAQHGKDYRWILAHYYQGTELGRLTNARQLVRVLLSSSSAAVFSGARRAGGKRLDPNKTYTVIALADGSLKLTNPKRKQVVRVIGPLIASGLGPLDLAGHGLYRGNLVFRPDGAGGVQTVDEVNLQDYVRGVVSWEMPSSWAPEALKVQALAARTYAITTNAGGAAFDQYADTRSQMYGGVAAETPATDAAVAATRGLVVIYGGKPVVTYFSSSSGGHTDSVQDVWPTHAPEPWLRGVPDPYDGAAGNPYHAWGSDMTPAAAAAKLGKLVKGTFYGVRVTREGSSPAVISAQVVGSRGVTTITGKQLQHIFGLLTTSATFTTISTYAVKRAEDPLAAAGNPVGATGATGGVPAAAKDAQAGGAQAMTALVPLVQSLVASATPELSGRIFPGHAGSPLTLQERTPSGWRTVGSGTVGAGGTYTVVPPGPGTYRMQYRGQAGPAVRAS
jgi:stage II sporulation protein D